MLDISHQTWRNAVIHVMNATIAHSLATLARKSQALNGIGSTITSMETTVRSWRMHLCGERNLLGAEGFELDDLGFGELAPGVAGNRRALTPGSAISKGAAHGRLRIFVFDSNVSVDSAAYPAYAHGHRRSVRVYGARRDVTRPPRFEMKELGEVTMVSMAHLADSFRELLG